MRDGQYCSPYSQRERWRRQGTPNLLSSRAVVLLPASRTLGGYCLIVAPFERRAGDPRHNRKRSLIMPTAGYEPTPTFIYPLTLESPSMAERALGNKWKWWRLW